MKTKFLLGLLAVIFIVCSGTKLNLKTPVPEGFMRVSIINKTDRLLCQNTYWLNHNIPSVLGPSVVCGGEVKPGETWTFDRNISSWNFQGTRVWLTEWSLCSSNYSKDEKTKWRKSIAYEIPEGTAIVEIHYNHHKIIPRS